MTLLSLNTGMRQGELFSLDWASVDLRMKTISVLANHSKGNKTRTIPLNPEAHAVLTTIKPEIAKGLVFKSPVTGGKFNNVKKAWGEVTKDAKVPELKWHDLRHDFASQLVTRSWHPALKQMLWRCCRSNTIGTTRNKMMPHSAYQINILPKWLALWVSPCEAEINLH